MLPCCGLSSSFQNLVILLKSWYKVPTPMEEHWDPPTMKTKRCILHQKDSTKLNKDAYAHRSQQWEIYGSRGALLSYEIVGPQPD
ncbi:Hypp1031 [Branchiostoma lanceolatum]|uniref:Hypp1031 protein n=1 Tax=Branchiostoma lanceolatum TaxID=7740 RepID=A0A8J9ZFT7_BRALA|nr:Hypp1031 [Branchiostoma lanceolatum]